MSNTKKLSLSRKPIPPRTMFFPQPNGQVEVHTADGKHLITSMETAQRLYGYYRPTGDGVSYNSASMSAGTIFNAVGAGF